MGLSANEVKVAEGKKAAAYVLDVPSDQLAGYLVVGILPDGNWAVSGSVDCAPHAAAILCDAASTMMYKLAEETPHTHST